MWVLFLPTKKEKKRGPKNPPGETKLEIVLFLTNAEKGRQEILSHLKEKIGIKENRGIDKHLNDLEKLGYIVKKTTGRGLPIHYELNHSFDGLMKLFILAKDFGKETEIMNSQYWRRAINVSIFKEISNRIEGKVDAKLPEDLPELLFPSNERYELVKLMRLSPSAFHYITSFGETEDESKIPILKAFTLPYQVQLVNTSRIKDESARQTAVDGLLSLIRETEKKWKSRPTPFLSVLRSMFVYDAFSGKVKDDDEVIAYVEKILGRGQFSVETPNGG